VDLAKQCLDVGLFTNRLEEMDAFYRDRLGLPFEELLPIGGGVQQHRYGLNGSVLKVNHSRQPLDDAPTGFRSLAVRHDGGPDLMADPDGLPVVLVPESECGITITVAVPDVDQYTRFLVDGMAAGGSGASWRIGTTGIEVEGGGRRGDGPTRARGFRYLTVQVKDCRAEHDRLLAAGVGVEGAMAPTRLGDTATIAMFRDPAGNWWEISERYSLTTLPRVAGDR
jgi:catechol 2,3-dioxygenase-like lactoylglutathione lyase family enzyme